ncbi:MAG: hypothetical protein KBA53_01600 [Thermoclostridium sp.]|nr:hypothetical protein [Thermoclostridium sp.]
MARKLFKPAALSTQFLSSETISVLQNSLKIGLPGFQKLKGVLKQAGKEEEGKDD